MKKFVAVLGCGPSGLVAAWAAVNSGYNVKIFSKKRRSELFGAQFLHQPIPGINVEHREVEYRLHGSVEGYRNRVYGEGFEGSVSVEDLIGYCEAWDIRETYRLLYEQFEDRIEHTSVPLDGLMVQAALRSKNWARDYEYTLSTIPLPSICLRPKHHKFSYQRIWAVGDAPERGIYCPIYCPKDKVICNGEPADSKTQWYRSSNVFGHTTVEWPFGNCPDLVVPAAEVKKPLDNICDCHQDIRMLGRYGAWRKGILVHQVYDEVEELLS